MNLKITRIKYSRFWIFLLLLICCQFVGYGQNISINETGTPPDASSILDINSNTMGLLIPRMTSIQKEAITDIADGLIVYDTDTKSIWPDRN